MNKRQKEEIVARFLLTPEGRKRLHNCIALSAAIISDQYPEQSIMWHLGRMLARLPLKIPKTINKRSQ